MQDLVKASEIAAHEDPEEAERLFSQAIGEIPHMEGSSGIDLINSVFGGGQGGGDDGSSGDGGGGGGDSGGGSGGGDSGSTGPSQADIEKQIKKEAKARAEASFLQFLQIIHDLRGDRSTILGVPEMRGAHYTIHNHFQEAPKDTRKYLKNLEFDIQALAG
jgi:hypothetical protein